MRTIKLTCAGCGAPLKVPDKATVLACEYCRISLKVVRDGGTVCLEVLGETLTALKDETSQVRLELKLSRLKEELRECRRDIKLLDKEIEVAKDPWKSSERLRTPLNFAALSALLAIASLVVTFGVLDLFWPISLAITFVVSSAPLGITWGIQHAAYKDKLSGKRGRLIRRENRILDDIDDCRELLEK